MKQKSSNTAGLMRMKRQLNVYVDRAVGGVALLAVHEAAALRGHWSELTERARLLLMASKLYRFAGLLVGPALVLGVVLWLVYGVGRGPGSGWLYAKLALVVVALGYHHACGSLLRKFEAGQARRSERWYRVFNEAAVLLFTAVVVLVVVKPF